MGVRSHLIGATALVLILAPGCGDEDPVPGSSRCARAFDSAGWREATRGDRQFDDRYEARRRKLAEDLLACRRLHRKPKAEVRRLLGSPRRQDV